MKINNNNYEAIFIDYLDGKLQAEQVAELLLFLEQHPDLKAELELFETTPLPLESVVFEGKESLKNIAKNNSIKDIDHYLIAELEGDLLSNEKVELERHLLLYPETIKAQQLFQQTKLSPDASIVYPEKNRLKREAKVFNLFYSSAAIAAAVIGFVVLFYFTKENTHNVNIANNSTIENKTVVAPKQLLASENRIPSINTKKEKAPVKSVRTKGKSNTILYKTIFEKYVPATSIKATNVEGIAAVDKYIILTNPPAVANLPIAVMTDKQELEIVNNDYLAPQEIVVKKIKSVAGTKENNKKLNGVDFLAIATKAFSKLTGRKVEVQEEVNQQGEVLAYSITSNNFEFHKALKKQ